MLCWGTFRGSICWTEGGVCTEQARLCLAERQWEAKDSTVLQSALCSVSSGRCMEKAVSAIHADTPTAPAEFCWPWATMARAALELCPRVRSAHGGRVSAGAPRLPFPFFQWFWCYPKVWTNLYFAISSGRWFLSSAQQWFLSSWVGPSRHLRVHKWLEILLQPLKHHNHVRASGNSHNLYNQFAVKRSLR